MRGTVAAAGRAAGTPPGLLLLLTGLMGAVQSGPVEVQTSPELTTDQVLRRVSDWLNTLDGDQRQRQLQHQQTLDGIQNQMDRMALELERLETKIDLKMDRLQEVLIGRDIKEEETSQRLTAQLQRIDTQIKGSLDQTMQKATSIQDQMYIFQASLNSDMKDIHRMISPFVTSQIGIRPFTSDKGNCARQRDDPATSDVSTVWTNDVMPELRRLADGVERLQRDEKCRAGADIAADKTERHMAADTERQEDGPAGHGAVTTVQHTLHNHDAEQAESFDIVMRLFEAIEQLEQDILLVSDQLVTGLDWLDKRVGHKFQDLRNELASMAASLRQKFFDRRDHLEEVAAKIITLQTAAVAANSTAAGGRYRDSETGTPLETVIAALEAAIYDVIDADLWYMLPTRLEEAVSGQGNLTRQMARVENDMHQGFSKLYAKLTQLSHDLKAARVSSRNQDQINISSQMEYMFGNISQQLHDIQFKLADQQAK